MSTQRTAHVMRISDWSSDVCSSDLRRGREPYAQAGARGGRLGSGQARGAGRGAVALSRHGRNAARDRDSGERRLQADGLLRRRSDRGEAAGRSEEHTSELQSLMRISYAVFCLKKKKKNMIR